MEKVISAEIATPQIHSVQKIATVMKLFNIQEVELHIRETDEGGYTAEFIDFDESHKTLEGYLTAWFNSVSWDEYLCDCFNDDDYLWGKIEFHDAKSLSVTIQYSVNQDNSNCAEETVQAGSDCITDDKLELLLAFFKDKKINNGSGSFSGGGDQGGFDELTFLNGSKKEVTPNNHNLESIFEDLIFNVASVDDSFNGDFFINGDVTFKINNEYSSITINVDTNSSYSETETIELLLDIKNEKLYLKDS